MIVLGIETSCDETSVSIVRGGRELLACVTASSMDLHAAYGGVVPEIAAREHIKAIAPTLDSALKQARIDWPAIDAIAVTYGAGLGGSLLVGVMTARTLAIVKNKPLYAANHVEGHIYASFLTRTSLSRFKLPQKQPVFPMLGLIVSGGHSQLVLWRDHFDYTLLGQTRDDAIGEAFDKVAKILGLPYPGGPAIGALAKSGDPYSYDLPKARLASASSDLRALRSTKSEARNPKMNAQNYDFSFSGLKTAVLRTAQKSIGESYDFPSFKIAGRLTGRQKADLAASFQRVAVETVVDKTILAYREFRPASIVVGGGAAANAELRRQLTERLTEEIRNQRTETGNKSEARNPKSEKAENILRYTDSKLMGDNGAMIAALGCYKAKLGQPPADPYSLEIDPGLSM